MAYTYAFVEKYDSAVVFFGRYAEKDQIEAIDLYYYATCQLGLKNYSLAIANYGKLLKNEEYRVAATYAIGNTYWEWATVDSVINKGDDNLYKRWALENFYAAAKEGDKDAEEFIRTEQTSANIPKGKWADFSQITKEAVEEFGEWTGWDYNDIGKEEYQWEFLSNNKVTYRHCWQQEGNNDCGDKKTYKFVWFGECGVILDYDYIFLKENRYFYIDKKRRLVIQTFSSSKSDYYENVSRFKMN